MFEASNLLEQPRQGMITRLLAASAAILAVPTAICRYLRHECPVPAATSNTVWLFVVPEIIAVARAILFQRFEKVGWL